MSFLQSKFNDDLISLVKEVIYHEKRIEAMIRRDLVKNEQVAKLQERLDFIQNQINSIRHKRYRNIFVKLINNPKFWMINIMLFAIICSIGYELVKKM